MKGVVCDCSSREEQNHCSQMTFTLGICCHFLHVTCMLSLMLLCKVSIEMARFESNCDAQAGISGLRDEW